MSKTGSVVVLVDEPSKDIGPAMAARIWGVLPQDVVLRVLPYLPAMDALRLRVVCKRWHARLHALEGAGSGAGVRGMWIRRGPAYGAGFGTFRTTSSDRVQDDERDRSNDGSFKLPTDRPAGVTRASFPVAAAGGVLCFKGYSSPATSTRPCRPCRLHLYDSGAGTWQQVALPEEVDLDGVALAVDERAGTFQVVLGSCCRRRAAEGPGRFQAYVYSSRSGTWAASAPGPAGRRACLCGCEVIIHGRTALFRPHPYSRTDDEAYRRAVPVFHTADVRRLQHVWDSNLGSVVSHGGRLWNVSVRCAGCDFDELRYGACGRPGCDMQVRRYDAGTGEWAVVAVLPVSGQCWRCRGAHGAHDAARASRVPVLAMEGDADHIYAMACSGPSDSMRREVVAELEAELDSTEVFPAWSCVLCVPEIIAFDVTASPVSWSRLLRLPPSERYSALFAEDDWRMFEIRTRAVDAYAPGRAGYCKWR